MTFELNRFIDSCLEATGAERPMERIRALLQAAVDDPMVAAALPDTGEDETLLHASPQLTVYMLRLTPRIHYPPHEHRMAAVIGLYEGAESNHLYRREGPSLVRTAVQESHAPHVIALAPEAIHSVVNPGPGYSRAIHVYLGPLTQIERSVWAADGTGERPFDNGFYFAQARPLSDELPDIPRDVG
jgi:predicted metal-dependent enzyme (double-stranded beta helix superfamily)